MSYIGCMYPFLPILYLKMDERDFTSIVTNTQNSLGWMDSNVKCILRRRLNDFSNVLFVCGLEADNKKYGLEYFK